MREARAIRRRPMGREEDRQRFDKTREVLEEQTRSVREEASEEDRRKWSETRDLSDEASEPPEDKHDRSLRPEKDQER
jgi:hypothetical protein